MTQNIQITAVMLTNDRIDRCLESVRHLAEALQGKNADILIINNGSGEIPISASVNGISCRIINNKRNLGAAARNIALHETNSRFLLMLDDDAYVSAQNIEEMTDILNSEPETAAVAFRIKNDLNEESCLLPTIFHGCACGFKADILREIGGYPENFQYYGEEYYVSLKIHSAGYKIALAGSPHIHHARDIRGRDMNRIVNLLVLNNIDLWISTFPTNMVLPAICDTLKRYRLVAKKENASAGYSKALRSLPLRALRATLRRKPVSSIIFKKVILINQIVNMCEQMHQQGIRTAVMCGIGKFPSIWLKIFDQYGISITSFWDTNPCWNNQTIKGIPIEVINISTPRANIKDGHCAFITGLSSLTETATWRQYLGTCCLKESPQTENSSPNGNYYLLESPKLSLFIPA